LYRSISDRGFENGCWAIRPLSRYSRSPVSGSRSLFGRAIRNVWRIVRRTDRQDTFGKPPRPAVGVPRRQRGDRSMAELEQDRVAIRKILSEFAGRRYSFGDIVNE